MDDLDKSRLPPIFAKDSTIHDHMVHAPGDMMGISSHTTMSHARHNACIQVNISVKRAREIYAVFCYRYTVRAKPGPVPGNNIVAEQI